jgi:fucose permease
VALVCFALTRSYPVAVGLLAVVGFLNSSFSALNNTLLMANTEPRLTGRVMSIYLLTWGAMPLGALPLAWLTDRAGAPFAIALAGAVVAVIVAGMAVLHPPAHRIGWVTVPTAASARRSN